MAKVIYNTLTDTISRYPRADDGPIKGLEPPLVVLTEIILDQPAHTEQQYLEATRVVDLEAATLTRGWVIKDLPPEPPEPRWQEFAAAISADPAINALISTAATSAPVLHLMLGVGLGQAAQGDGQTFRTAWTAALDAGLVAPELATSTAALAATYDLPQAFIAVVDPPEVVEEPVV